MLQSPVLSSEIEAAANLPGGSIRYLARQLPVERHGRKGRARKWTVRDALLVIVASAFVMRGYQTNAAISFTEQLLDEIEVLASDPEAVLWLFVMLDPTGESEFRFCVTKDSKEGWELFEDCPGVSVTAVHKVIADALAAIEAERQGATQ